MRWLLAAGLWLAGSASGQRMDWERDPVAQARYAGLLPSPPPTPDQLACDPAVIAAFKASWKEADYGVSDVEAAFRMDWIGGRLQIVHEPPAPRGEYFQRRVSRTNRTIAIAHTHPRSGAAPPSDQDLLCPVPNFVVTDWNLYVTLPGTGRWRVARKNWDRPCGR
ncbi:MAG: hypothetical protein HY554_11020 [Elusimicrobia bacterium]|nr:hypothetical protein [Elusimicrobiota bacterium]